MYDEMHICEIAGMTNIIVDGLNDIIDAQLKA
jgi:hypothetical protein